MTHFLYKPVGLLFSIDNCHSLPSMTKDLSRQFIPPTTFSEPPITTDNVVVLRPRNPMIDFVRYVTAEWSNCRLLGMRVVLMISMREKVKLDMVDIDQGKIKGNHGILKSVVFLCFEGHRKTRYPGVTQLATATLKPVPTWVGIFWRHKAPHRFPRNKEL